MLPKYLIEKVSCSRQMSQDAECSYMMAMRIEKVKTAHLKGRFCFLTGNDHIARPQTATKQIAKIMMMALSIGSWNLEPDNSTLSVQTD